VCRRGNGINVVGITVFFHIMNVKLIEYKLELTINQPIAVLQGLF